MSSSSSAQSHVIGGKIEFFCNCNRQLRVQTSTTRTNLGKRYVKCGDCRVYEFLDDDLPSQYYKDLVYGFQRHRGMDTGPMIEALALEKSRLEDELKVTKSTLEDELKARKAKLELYDRLFMVMLGCLCVICVGIAQCSQGSLSPNEIEIVFGKRFGNE
ncbi:hypothetical protein CTI12_AA476900 [Artemisia annua]|uniref:Uncharacterized protein n=1 Tax=Artemisia annua TaxID=35608 RepID=A0A2U1LLU5_ARTAN|nr:hypothetical protein CTI12_AA476900 [Artemisia annua]